MNMIEHPAVDIKYTKSDKLKNKNIVLCSTSGIGIVEVVKLIRELIRHGGEIYPVLSKDAQKLISQETLRFAAGKPTITEITGDIEHIMLCGDRKEKADILLIAPCTANTLSKIAAGICDTTVTLFALTAIGSKIPILIVPAMHISMYNNELIMENMRKLEKTGIKFITPKFDENKAKMPSVDEIVMNVIRSVGDNKLKSKKCLIISGSTEEYIDDVRVITSRFSGKTGIELAKSFFLHGGDIELWYAHGKEKPPEYIKTSRFSTISDLIKKIETVNFDYDIIVMCAALADYIPYRMKGKISSIEKELLLTLHQAPKVIEILRKKFNGYLVGFKLESNVEKEKLIEIAQKKLKDVNLDLVIANDIKNYSENENEIIIVDRSNFVFVKDRKNRIAEKIIEKIVIDVNSKTK